MLEFEWLGGRAILVPGGRRNEQTVIGRITIANVTETGLGPIGDYLYAIERDGRVSRKGEVTGHVREDGWEPLIARCLADDSRLDRATAVAQQWRDRSARVAENSADPKMVAAAQGAVKAMDAVLAALTS